MSRCYPYPPPGYVKNGIRDEALIESIKIQREVQKAKKERKKEKREKKEKKRDKKERDKVRDGGDIESNKHSHKKRRKVESSQEAQKGDNHQKRVENEVESFEKSTLTEEHCHGVGSQNSSDSTLNSNERQKLRSPSDIGQNSGSIIRIRFRSQRQKDPEVLPSKEQPCSTSGRTDDDYAQGMHEPAPRPDRELEEHPSLTPKFKRPELTFKLSKDNTCSSSNASESMSHNADASLPSNLCSSCSPSLALQFKNLVEDWVVPTLQNEYSNLGNEDWLLQPKQAFSASVKSIKDGTNGLSQMNSTAFPHASYLPDADIYALPYSIPF